MLGGDRRRGRVVFNISRDPIRNGIHGLRFSWCDGIHLVNDKGLVEE